MWQVFFAHRPVERFRQGRRNDAEFYHHFQTEMQARGVYFHNYQMERWFACTEHTMDDVELTLDTAREAVEAVKRRLGRTVVSEH
jgi:glutamate-1-semialdehyde aminotransferase